jgi:hypothetical protein
LSPKYVSERLLSLLHHVSINMFRKSIVQLRVTVDKSNIIFKLFQMHNTIED